MLNDIKVDLLSILKITFGDQYTYEEINLPKGTTHFTFLEDKPYKVDDVSTIVFPNRIVLSLYKGKEIHDDQGNYLLYDSCEEHKVVYYGFVEY